MLLVGLLKNPTASLAFSQPIKFILHICKPGCLVEENFIPHVLDEKYYLPVIGPYDSYHTVHFLLLQQHSSQIE